MKTELMLVTPQQAQKWLTETNINNRRLDDKTVAFYAREMSDGRWNTTHQGIAFYKDGTLADGQHRLAAIAKANKDITVLVTTDLDKETYAGIDLLRAKSLNDVIKIGGKADWLDPKSVETVRVIYDVNKIGADEAIVLAENVKESLIFTSMCFSKRTKGAVATLRGAFTLAHYYGENEDRLIEFSEMFYSGMVKDEGDISVIRLRDYLIKGSSGRSGTERNNDFLKIQNIIKKFLTHTPVGSVRQIEKEIYPKLDPKPILSKKGQ